MKSNTLLFHVVLLICSIIGLSPLNNLHAQIQEQSTHQIPGFLKKTGLYSQAQLSTPSFSNRIRIQAGGVNMKVDSYTSVPWVVDWNGDGKKDLLVGCFYNGNVYFFKNSGTDASPVFTTGTKLKADGQEISVAFG
jgi:hypothetical protein